MSFNRFMHPRNIYKNQADFKTLALEFPEFRKYANQELSGKITIDFKNPEALRALTTTLLKKDFNLDVEIPPNRLIPTVPLRLNYILWLEDIFENSNEDLQGIDIGTGASCIYPLLGAKKNNWNFLAIELDPESFACAERNVINNDLRSKIKVILGQNETIILKQILPENETYHFCMCNPPFFSNELDINETDESSNSASIIEKVTKGGEVEFVQTIIQESIELKNKIKVYTTMLGKKTSLKILKNELKKFQLKFITTEFCQGKTMRWGLAWTLDEHFKFPNVQRRVKKSKPPLTFVLPKPTDPKLYKIGVILSKIRLIVQELWFEWEEVKLDQNYVKLIVKAKQNTWSNQRRKRRALLRMQKDNSESMSKRTKLEDETDQSSGNQDKIPELQQKILNVLADVKAHAIKAAESKESFESYVLQFSLCLKHPAEGIVLELKYIDGLGYDLLHQVYQYFKNKLKPT